MGALFVVLLPVLIGAVVMAVALATQSQQRTQQRTYWRSLTAPQEQLPQEPTCPRCQSAMVRGYLLDRTYNGFGVGTWIEGPPEISGFPDLVRPRLKRSIPIASYRCTGCGYLELYARPELVEELGTKKPTGYPEL